MPWSVPMDQKKRFIEDVEDGIFSVAELCRRNGISRKTGYKMLGRYAEEGEDGLRERSRRPHTCPHQTAPHVEARLEALRRAHPHWGAETLLGWLRIHEPGLKPELPASSTAHQVLRRAGLVVHKRRHRSRPPTLPPQTKADEPNKVWTADFKGDFLTKNGTRVYPLTIADDFSRYLLECKALRSTEQVGAMQAFEQVFREFGLPEVIRTDNGVPFATNALARLSRMAVWWLHLGIVVERIEPGRPEQNGRHERMHRTLKASCARPAAGNLQAQQRSFNRFREEYNHERPHQALDGRRPRDLYCRSPRPYPNALPEIVYPNHFELRVVSNTGSIRLHNQAVFLSNALEGEIVGAHEIDDDVWSIMFASIELGRYDKRTERFHTGGILGPRAANNAEGYARKRR